MPGVEGRGSWGGKDYIMGRRYFSEVMKSLETRESRCLHNIGNALNATDLYALKLFTVCDVNFNSIERKNKESLKKTSWKSNRITTLTDNHSEWLIYYTSSILFLHILIYTETYSYLFVYHVSLLEGLIHFLVHYFHF